MSKKREPVTRDQLKPGLYIAVGNELYKVNTLYDTAFSVRLLYPPPQRTTVSIVRYDRLEMFTHPSSYQVRRYEGGSR